MGLGLKVGLLLFALLASAFGGWVIAVPILAYLFVPPLLRSGGRGRAGTASSKGKLSSSAKVIGALFVLLSAVAFISGGTFSPMVFLSVGLVLLLWGHVHVRFASRAVLVDDSILLRSRLNPFRWTAVTEAKAATRDVEGALSGVGARIVLVSDPAPRILIAFTALSLGRAGAEERVVSMIQSAARALIPLGVYLLPLDSAEASSATELRSLRVRAPAGDLKQFLSASDYGAAAAEAERGFVTSFALYARPDAAKGISALTDGLMKSPGQLTLSEFLHAALQKVGSPHPDRYAAFLSSVAATAGETLGQRLTQTEGRGGQVLSVASVGTPQVELSRGQLRAITRIYE
ncbi:MAG: hypothetical protein JRN08_08030 [Nitrososphaerota archaeon]|nr:hypothetical protein [Nitrososphaerota archaeon]